MKNLCLDFRFIVLRKGTHLFVKVPRPGDNKGIFSVFESKLPPVTTSLTILKVKGNPVKIALSKHVTSELAGLSPQ